MASGGGPTLALVHATPAAMAPAVAAFGERFPEAGLWHLLDDRLVTDAERAGGLVPPLRRRMLSLIGHAVAGGADGVLLTCSMYGPVARLAAQLWDRPVAGSDEAMYERVAADRPARVAVLGSLRSAAKPLAGEVDLFLLGQYSLSPARAELQAALEVPVWSPPHVAADALRERLRPAWP